jgi:hypothetical protein
LIEKLIVDENYRLEMGKKAFTFVQKHWSQEAFAKRFQVLIYDTYPKEWLYDPQHIRYVHGWGLSETKCKELLKEIITKGGVKALQLQDKPELEKAFLKFAGMMND